MSEQRDSWLAMEQWRADNQKWNHRPSWEVDQFAPMPAGAGRRSDQVLVWLGRNLTTLGIWLQTRYGDACLIEIEARRWVQTSRG